MLIVKIEKNIYRNNTLYPLKRPVSRSFWLSLTVSYRECYISACFQPLIHLIIDCKHVKRRKTCLSTYRRSCCLYINNTVCCLYLQSIYSVGAIINPWTIIFSMWEDVYIWYENNPPFLQWTPSIFRIQFLWGRHPLSSSQVDTERWLWDLLVI